MRDLSLSVRQYLKYSPKHQAKAGIFWQNKILNTNIDMLYKSKQYSNDLNTSDFEAYVTFDLQFSKQILKNLRAEFLIHDLFDNQTMENNFSHGYMWISLLE